MNTTPTALGLSAGARRLRRSPFHQRPPIARSAQPKGRALLFALAAASLGGSAFAQSAPGLSNGQMPTAAQWNGFFAAKQDYVPGALTVLGPGSSVAGDALCWNSTYPQVYDCGAFPTVSAGTGIAVTGTSNAYKVALSQFPRGYIDGLTLSTAGSSASFGVAAGQATDSTGAVTETLASSVTKTTSAWASGSAAGCLDTGTIANATWYHVFIIEKADQSAVDELCSLSATAPTMPSGYTYFRRIGSLLTDGSAHWVRFVQSGDEFRWYTPINDVNVATLGTTATAYTISVPPNVPVVARERGAISSASVGTAVLITSPLVGSPSVGSPTGEETVRSQVANNRVSFTLGVLTSNQQITAVAGAAATSLYVDTYGWVDRRGRSN